MNIFEIIENGTTPQVASLTVDSGVQLVGILTTLAIVLVVATALLAIFEFLRHRLPTIYCAKPHYVNDYGLKPVRMGIFGWLISVIRQKDDGLDSIIGSDQYLHLMMMKYGAMFFVIMVFITFIIVIPSNKSGAMGLDDLQGLSMSNIRTGQSILWVHYVVSVIVVSLGCGYMFLIHQQFLSVYRRFLVRKYNSNRRDSRTVLLKHLDRGLRDEVRLRAYIEQLGIGEVEEVNVHKRYGAVRRSMRRRDATTRRLEGAYFTFFLNMLDVNGQILKITQEKFQYIKSKYPIKQFVQDVLEDQSILNQVDPQYVPLVRKGVPCINQRQLNALSYYQDQKEKAEQELDYIRQVQKLDARCSTNAFVTFKTAKQAILASQVKFGLQSTIKASMAPEPRDILWPSLDAQTQLKDGRRFLILILSILIIIFWFVPLAFITSLISLNYLSVLIPGFEEFVNRSQFLRSLITSVLPPLLVNILMQLLPMLLWFVTGLQKPMTFSNWMESAMKRYYGFLVINVLIFVSLGTTFLTSLSVILNNPARVIPILGVALPAASGFFINYIVLTFSGFALQLLQPPKLWSFFIWPFLKTPRQKSTKHMPLLPVLIFMVPMEALIFTIAYVYSVIAPLITIFAAASMALKYLSYKHQYMYVFNPVYEDGGRWWLSARYFFCTAICIFIITMCGIFALKQAFVQAGLMLPLFVLVIAIMRHTNYPRHKVPLDIFSYKQDCISTQSKHDQQKKNQDQVYKDVESGEPTSQNTTKVAENVDLLLDAQEGHTSADSMLTSIKQYYNTSINDRYIDPCMYKDIKLWLPDVLMPLADAEINWNLCGKSLDSSKTLSRDAKSDPADGNDDDDVGSRGGDLGDHNMRTANTSAETLV
ncbi:hypothetical protein MP228_007047 [Amoeboaphelidium protococcarum]|nr:hypothetical protein MP228_007047 [Amoeboaphelidium protococcarum]